MCIGCWQGEDSPTDWSPQIARAVLLWRRLYDDLKQPTGGPLHVALDDCNLQLDDEIAPIYALSAYNGRPASDDGYPPEVHEVCDELAALLTAMTLPERYATMAYADGFITPPGMPEVDCPATERVIVYPSGQYMVKLTHPSGVRAFSSTTFRSVENARASATQAMRMRLHLEALDAAARKGH